MGYLDIDNSKFNSKLNKAQSALATFADSSESTGKRISSLGTAITNAGAQLTTKVTTPIVAAAGAAIKFGADFDSAMAQVAATMNEPISNITELRDLAIQMGEDTKFTATESAEALNYLALAGYSAEQQMVALPKVLTLAAAGNMDLATASDLLTDSMSALGLSSDNTTVLMDNMQQSLDVVAYGATQTNENVEQFMRGLVKVGATARQLGGDTDDMNYAFRQSVQVLGLLADAGIKSTEGGTHLRNIILAMTPSTEKASKAWDQLGVSAYDSSGNLRSLEDIFLDLSDALEPYTDEERQDLIKKMFKQTDIASVNYLLSVTKDEWDDLGDSLLDVAKDGEAAQKMQETQLDNLKGDWTYFTSALGTAFINVSDIIKPKLREIVQAATELVREFNNLDKPMQEKILKIAGIAAAVGPALVVVGKLTSAFGSTISVIEKVTSGVGGLAKKISELSEAKKAVEGVGTALEVVSEVSSGAGSVVGTAFTEASSSISSAAESISSAAESIGSVTDVVSSASDAYKLVDDVIIDTGDDIIKSTNSLLELPDIISDVAENVSTALVPVSQLPTEISSTAELATSSIGELSESLGQNFSSAAGGIIDDLDVIDTHFVETGTAAGGLGEAMDATFTTAGSGATGLLGSIGSVVAAIGLIAAAIAAVIVVVAGFKAAWEEDFGGIQENTQNIINNIKGWFEGIVGVVKNVVSAIVSAWESDWGGIRTTVETVISFVIQTISTLTDIISGIISGIKQMWDENWFGMQDAVAAIGSAIENNIQHISNFIQAILNVASAIQQFISDHQEAISTITQVVAVIVGIVAAINTVIGVVTTVAGVIAGISSAIATVVSFISGVISAVTTVIGVISAVIAALNPVTVAIAAVIAVIAALVVAWKKDLGGIQEKTKAVVDAVINFFKNLVAKVKEIPSNVKEFATNFVKFIEDLPYNIGKILGYVIAKVILFVANFVTKAEEGAINFVKAYINYLTTFPGKVWNFLKNAISKAADFAKSFSEKAKEAAVNFVTKLAVNISKAPDKIKKIATKMVNEVKGLPKKFLEFGKNVVDGLVNGVKDRIKAAKDAVKDFASGIVDGFKSALGIASPSKVMKKQVGNNIAEGVIKGMKEKLNEGKVTASEYASTLVEAAEKVLDEFQTYNKLTAKDEVNYWKTILKSLKKGSDEYTTVYKKYVSAKESYNEQVTALDEQYLSDQNEIFEKLQSNINSLTEAYDDALKSRTEQLLSSFKLFEKYDTYTDTTADTLVDDLQSQVDALKNYNEQINALVNRGILSDDLLDEIKDLGVDATGEIVALNSMSDDELVKYDALWKEKMGLAAEQAEKELEPLKDTTQKQIQALQDTAQEELTALAETYVENLKELGVDSKTIAKKIGKNVAKSIAISLDDNADSVYNSLSDMSTTITNTLNKLLKDVKSTASEIASTVSKAKETASSISSSASKVAYQAGTVKHSNIKGSYKSGLDYVPYDGYIAQLHKGEAVLTAQENANRNSTGNSNVFNFYGTPALDERETARQMKLAQQQLAMGF
jgi:TP901 family phage tail tape measure protein